MGTGLPVLVIRGGGSKGAYFLASDLPDDRVERDTLLLAVMGSPDPRQVDGDRWRSFAGQQGSRGEPFRGSPG
ncbi:PrpF domain-containing protein [Actinoplanes missouriensis]|uniref:PrpF domain-containing protein n=1 Tax=Actinoplanes missouriensis TaxID=1866 RepID=UPI0033D88777